MCDKMGQTVPGIYLLMALVGLIQLMACSSPSDYSHIPTDSLTVEKGKVLFVQNCSACHDFRRDGIGPQLGGLTEVVSSDWIRSFIGDPKRMIDSGDERSVGLYKQFNSYMPSFGHLEQGDIDAVIAYLTTVEAPIRATELEELKELEYPIKTPIVVSNLIVNLEYIAQIPPSSDRNPLARIAKMDYQPMTNDFFVLDLRGKLYRLEGGQSNVYLDMNELMPDFIDQPGLATGFGSFAFHPDFQKNGLLYTTHTEPAGNGIADFALPDSVRTTLQWVISEWKADDPGAFPFAGNHRELFRVDMMTGVHGVQEITFNPLARPQDEDYGLLYIGIGDGGSVGSGYPVAVTSMETPWGKIVRIDPQGSNSKNRQYGISENNPFARGTNGGALGEIYASGFRNPHRISWTKSGDMIVSNIGQSKIESLYKISPGQNHGWPIREGTFLVNTGGDINKVYPLPADDASFSLIYPIAQYSHNEGNAISGGFEYWGESIPLLRGKYIFGDIVKARLFYVDVADIRLGKQAPIKELRLNIDGKETSFGEIFDNRKVDIRFGRDHLGEIWLSSKIDGKIYKLRGAQQKEGVHLEGKPVLSTID